MLRSKYAYVRVTIKGNDLLGIPVEVVVGVAYTPLSQAGERMSARAMYEQVRIAMERELLSRIPDEEDEELAAAAESVILKGWPGLSYFIEVGRGDLDQWVQVFQPDKDDWLAHESDEWGCYGSG